MFYLTQMLDIPVMDAAGEEIGDLSDVAIEAGEIFPRVTSLAFTGPGKQTLHLSWRKYVEDVDDERVLLNVARTALRFSYIQPDEVLLHRDLLNKQIVDTQGKKVVRVNDLKLSRAKGQLRLLGAEVGARGILRGISPAVERVATAVLRVVGIRLSEKLIAWNYMDLLDRDLTQVKLSVTHKRLHELHPADVADILEQLAPSQRASVFTHLDIAQAAEAIAEMEDEYQAQVLEEFSHQEASDILETMDPDDAADIISGLDYERAEKLLRLMGVREAHLIRSLLGYREESAGGIMTSEITAVTEDMDLAQVIDYLRNEAPTGEDTYYIYVVDDERALTGVIDLRQLITNPPHMKVEEIERHDIITVDVDDDQEHVAEIITKYNLLAVPVTDETGKILGVVTVDDALEVLEEESAEDLALATGSRRKLSDSGAWSWLVKTSGWITIWLVLGVAAAVLLRSFSDSLATVLPAVFFLPLVLRLAEDVSAHSLGVLIEHSDDPEGPSVAQRFFIDAGAGAALALVSGLLVFGMLEAFGEPHGTAIALSVAAAAAVLGTSLLSALVPTVAISAGAAHRIPSTLLTTVSAVAGLAIYIAAATYLQDTIRL